MHSATAKDPDEEERALKAVRAIEPPRRWWWPWQRSS